jgi:hypothetical protein
MCWPDEGEAYCFLLATDSKGNEMRLVVSTLCLLLLGIAGCNPVKEIRKMRENDRQMQEENNQRQVKKALENFNKKYEGSDNAEDENNESSQP